MKVIIFGTGGNCLDMLDTINDINSSEKMKKYKCLGFLDDDKSKSGRKFMGASILGPLAMASKFKNTYFVNGIGSPANYYRKEEIIKKGDIPSGKFISLIHPTASVSHTSILGHGVVVFQHVTITTNVRIGNHVIILPNTVISHDGIIGDYACITGNVCVSGNVNIGKSCYLGAGCVIRDGVTIGDYSLIGMGAVVTKDIPSNVIVAGNPARIIRKIP